MTPAERLTVVRYRAGLDDRDWALVAKYREEARRRDLGARWAVGVAMIGCVVLTFAFLPLGAWVPACGLVGLCLGALYASSERT